MPKPLDLLAKLRAFEAAHPSQPGPRCSICQLPNNLRTFILDGRKAGSTHRAIAAVITEEGHRVTAYTVSRHLRDGHGV